VLFGEATGQSDPHTIASGIAEALTTTVAGLAIAIPCLIAYSCFVRKIETIASEMAIQTVSLFLSQSYRIEPGDGLQKLHQPLEDAKILSLIQIEFPIDAMNFYPKRRRAPQVIIRFVDRHLRHPAHFCDCLDHFPAKSNLR
jgi:hypothetical protein